MRQLSAMLILTCLWAASGLPAKEPSAWEDGVFSWKASGPLLDAGARRDAADPAVALKDPSIVFHEARWHLFGTLRRKSGTVCMEYLSFADWADAKEAPREVISFTE